MLKIFSIFYRKKNKYYQVETVENQVNKLFFSTQRMTKNYELSGDISLIDSTYRVNHYNLPLIVYSRINAKSHNVIFAKKWVICG